MERLEAMGWSPVWASALQAVDPSGAYLPARVSLEQRGVYGLWAAAGELRAERAGKLVHHAESSEALPTVGDWVAMSPHSGGAEGTIHHVLARASALTRRRPDRPARSQVLAANVDVVFVVTSANQNFNPRRIERTLAVVAESGADAVLVLSKLDLCGDLGELAREARGAAGDTPVLPLSSQTGEGIEAFVETLGPGRTGVLVGSSGVGKSTLTNRLLGADVQKTLEVRADDDRGRHATSHRELFLLPGGGVLIDTPGIREIGLWADEGDVGAVFSDVEELAAQCRFHDCGHAGEPDCAVQAEIAAGRLDPARLESMRKLEREAQVIRAKRDARARHEDRKEKKRFAKKVRNRPDKRRPPQ